MAILADRLFGFYHEQEVAADQKMFMTAVVELFCNYPHEVVLKAVSPVFGMPGKYKYPPRLAEIKEFLDELMAPVWREQDRQRRISPPEPVREYKSKPGVRQYSYGEFLKMAEEGKVAPRPVGRFEEQQDRWNQNKKSAALGEGDVKKFREKFQISDEQWKEIPDA